jgi:hypothetical protein
MAGIIARRTFETTEFEWYMSDMRGLLDVNSSPQELADNALTIAQNVYGSFDGGVIMRNGMEAHGIAFGGSNPVIGLFELVQQVINGNPQASAVETPLAQIEGTLYNETTKAQIGATGALGVAPLPWQAQPLFDADHLITAPAPTVVGHSSGGSLVTGTYLISITYVDASGETLCSFDVQVTIVAPGAHGSITVDSPPAVSGATGWNAYCSTAGGGTSTETKQNSSATAIGTNFTITSITSGAARPSSSTVTTIAPSDVVVICTGSGGPYIYDGNSIYTPSAWSANCSGARWCQVINNVLFFGGIPAQENLVVGMLLGHPETFTAANTFSTSHFVTGLGTIGTGAQASLAIGMVQGLTLLNGTGINTFEEAEVPMDDGVASGLFMVNCTDPLTGLSSLFFVGGTDVYQLTSTNLIPIGLNVRPYILNDPTAVNPWDIPMNGSRALTWGFYYNNRVYMWYDSGNVGYPNVALVWDLYLRGWTTYIGANLNCAMTLNGPNDANPPVLRVGDSVKAQTYTFDVSNGTGQNVDDNGTAINVIVQTKFFKLGIPSSPKKVRRVYPELFAQSGFVGNIGINADYGPGGGGGIIQGPSGSGMLWDTDNWDVSNWFQGGLINYVSPPANRVDANVPGDAFAFSILSTIIQSPFRLQGFKILFTQNPTR